VEMCPFVLPQFNQNMCQKYHASVPGKREWQDKYARWLDHKKNFASELTVPCEQTANADAPSGLTSKKYKFHYMELPQTDSGEVEKLIKNAKVLETERTKLGKRSEDFHLVVTAREPLSRFATSVARVMKERGVESADKEHLQTVLGETQQSLWPAWEARILTKPTAAPALLWGVAPQVRAISAQPVSFVVRRENAKEDLDEFWDKLEVPKEGRPAAEFEEQQTTPAEDAVKKAIVNDRLLRHDFCSMFKEDYVCLGYHTEFETLCGEFTEPSQFAFPRESVEKLSPTPTTKALKNLAHADGYSCNIKDPSFSLIEKFKYVKDVNSCERRCETHPDCESYQYDQTYFSCELHSEAVLMSEDAGKTCGIACENHEAELRVWQVPKIDRKPECHTVAFHRAGERVLDNDGLDQPDLAFVIRKRAEVQDSPR